MTGAKAITMLVPIFILPYISRKVGSEGFGYISYGLAFGVLFETYLRYGFDLLAIRDGSISIASGASLNNLFSRVLLARLILFFLGLGVSLLVVMIVHTRPKYENLIYLNLAFAAFNVFSNDWVYQAFERMHYLAVFTFMGRCLYVLVVLIFVQNPEDVIFEPIAMVIASFAIMLMSNYILFRRFNIRIVAVPLRVLMLDLRNGFGLFLTFLAPNLYTNLSAIYLNKHGLREVGIFYGGYRFISVFESLNQTIARVFYPKFAKSSLGFTTYLRVGICITSFISIALYFSAEIIVDIFLGEVFYESIVIIKVMCVSPVLLFIMFSFGQNKLVLMGRTAIYTRIVLTISVIGGIFSFLLIKYMGATGASIAIVTTWFLRSLITFIYSKINTKS